MIPPGNSSAFVAQMEQVLDIYKQPYDSLYPVVCMDESPQQLIAEIRAPIPMQPGKEKKVDYEYFRCGVCNIFMANEPLKGHRIVKVTQHKKKADWAMFMKEIADQHYPDAIMIRLVMDNLNTHVPGSLYETFAPKEAKRIWDRFQFIYTPKHGSWLNMAEIEINVLNKQCLNRRIDSIETIKSEVKAWCKDRNNKNAKINWQFTTDQSRIKLKHLYPKYHD